MILVAHCSRSVQNRVVRRRGPRKGVLSRLGYTYSMSLSTIKPGSLGADYYSLNDRIKAMLLGENVHGRKVSVVGRYLSNGTKGVTRKEVEWLHENEIAIHFIYEETNSEILGGARQGERAAKNALALINSKFKEYPAGAPIVACADMQVHFGNVRLAIDYMEAFQRVLKADGRYILAGYADSYLASRFQFPFVTIPGASSWSRGLFSAVKDVDRFDVPAMKAGFSKAGVPNVTMLQKLDSSKLVDWLYVYQNLPAWLPNSTLDPFFTKIQKKSSGHQVKVLQALLTANGHVLLLDGKFGPQTEGAVKAFQRIKKLPVTGIVETLTWSALLS